MNLGPNTQHDVAEEEGVEGDQRDVAAEVEGEDDADEEEEHSPRFFPFEVLSRQDRHPDRHPDRHQQRGGEHSEERPEIHHPLPLACEGRRLLSQADHARRDRCPHAGFNLQTSSTPQTSI